MRFLVPLSNETKIELHKLAKAESRDMRDQAALLIEEGLKQRQGYDVQEIRLILKIQDGKIDISNDC